MDNSINAGPASGFCVLLLDDDVETRTVLSQALSRNGHEVISAASAREAFQQMMHCTIDVVVVDIHMPEMSGDEFLREALNIWPWMGIVVVSGHLTDPIVDKLRSLGVARFLNKPASIDVLVENVVAAAHERPRPADFLPAGNLLAIMRNHLRRLSDRKKMSLRTNLLADVLYDFFRDLRKILVGDMLGLLVVEKLEAIYIVSLRQSVSQAFVDSVYKETIARYQVINGRDIHPGDVEIRYDGEDLSADALDQVGTMLCMPVFMDGDVFAILTMASHSEEPYSKEDASLLYLVGNHMAALALALRRMQNFAMRDGLTGLFNRSLAEEELKQTWKIMRRYDASMAVVVLDLDHFKVVNDTYGHAFGDQVLCEFADLFRDAARESDILARFGGDEFLAVLPYAAVDEARVFCGRLLEATRRHVFCPDTYHLNLTVSIGMATCRNSACPANPGELLSQADRVLYRAKRSGRNRVCVWNEEVQFAESSHPTKKMDLAVTERLNANIIVLDDDEQVLQFLDEVLTKEGFDVHTFNSAEDALATIENIPYFYDIVLTDILMPNMDGIEMMGRISDADPLIVKMAMSGHAEADTIVRCIHEDTIDFLQKPIRMEDLRAAVNRAMGYRRLKLENMAYQQHLEHMVEQRNRQLRRLLEKAERSYEYTIDAFMAILDARTRETGQHSLRASAMAVWLAKRMNVTEEELEKLGRGALLHDIGKIFVPERILINKEKLSPEERKIMDEHPKMAAKILSEIPHFANAARIVGEHHEHYDGKGYPEGLSGEEICIGARIFALVDAYDAMRSDRLYSSSISEADTVAEIISQSGKQFDPKVVEVFARNREEFAEMYKQLCEREPPPFKLDGE